MATGLSAQESADSTGHSDLDSVVQWLGEHELVGQLGGLLVIALAAFLADFITKKILLATIAKIVRRTTFTWDDVLQKHRVFERLAHIAPGFAIYYGI